MSLSKLPGAKCDDCPYKDCDLGPRYDQRVPNPKLVLVKESPDFRECKANCWWVGADGVVLSRNIQSLGIDRRSVFTVSVLACRPRGKPKKKDLKKAAECCKERFEHDLPNAGPGTVVLALGDLATNVLTGLAGASRWRGFWYPGWSYNVLPTYSLFEIRHRPPYEPVFRIDLQRAWEGCTNGLNITEWPELCTDGAGRTIAALQRILAVRMPVGVDIETGEGDLFNCVLTCIGIANEDVAVSVPWDPYYAGEWGFQKGLENAEIRRLVKEILASDIPKVMQNGGHDLLGLSHHNIECNNLSFDTLIAHSIVAPQVAHNLGFIASCEFCLPRWKTIFGDDTDEKGLASYVKRNPSELRDYNAKDAWVTCKLKRPLEQRLDRTHNGWELFTEAMALDKLGMEMREYGLPVNAENRSKHREILSSKLTETRDKFAALTPWNHVVRGKDNYRTQRANKATGTERRRYQNSTEVYVGKYRLGKVGSHRDIGRLFYEHYGLEVTKRTDEGDPALDADVLAEFCGHADPIIAETARTVLAYRQYGKLLTTYVDGLPEINGRIHAVWKVYGTITGRWSSREPNAQNIPPAMRDMFESDDGMYLMAADYSQLELRLAAMFSGDTKFLEWYSNGRDVHSETAKSVFRTLSPTDKQRKMAKGVIYGSGYGGGPETIWRALLKKGVPISLAVVKKVLRVLQEEHPELAAWQAQQISRAEITHYIEDPISGRREHFHDGYVEPTKVKNYPMQAGAGSIMNAAILHLDKLLKASKAGRIVLQVHDEIVIQTSDPTKAWELFQKAMPRTLTHNGNTMTFPIDIAIGTNWGRMEDLNDKKDLLRFLAGSVLGRSKL